METTYTKLDDKTLEISTPQSPVVTRITLAEARKNQEETQQRRDEATASYLLEDIAYADKIAAEQAVIDMCISNGIID